MIRFIDVCVALFGPRLRLLLFYLPEQLQNVHFRYNKEAREVECRVLAGHTARQKKKRDRIGRIDRRLTPLTPQLVNTERTNYDLGLCRIVTSDCIIWLQTVASTLIKTFKEISQLDMVRLVLFGKQELLLDFS